MKRYTPDTSAAKEATVAEMSMGHTAEEYAAAMPDAEVIVADAIADISGALIDLLPHLKLIHSEGVAYNRIDTEAASARQIPVCKLRRDERLRCGGTDDPSHAGTVKKYSGQ